MKFPAHSTLTVGKPSYGHVEGWVSREGVVVLCGLSSENSEEHLKGADGVLQLTFLNFVFQKQVKGKYISMQGEWGVLERLLMRSCVWSLIALGC